EQNANSKAKNEQTNVNAPISVLSVGSNNGKVDQSNHGKTSSRAGNSNETAQGNWQSQDGSAKGSDAPRSRGSSDCPPKGEQGRPEGEQGSPKGDQGRGSSKVKQSQDANNDNSTEQNAESSASNDQSNYNLPVSILSVGSNGGKVKQSNDGHTSSKAGNSNWTGQGNDQSQEGSAKGSKDDRKPADRGANHGDGGDYGDRDQSAGRVKQDHDASNDNSTEQNAESSASNDQSNYNVPVSILSVGSNGDGDDYGDCGDDRSGKVDQSNDAKTRSEAGNWNGTQQGNWQKQAGSAR
ncbi:MAG TPA: hypothetical protein VH025_11330, partial [Solirubrobacteraceae bacterium]|nr:hypothetical protein [Solirubrobacteraceae bacterium]